jgi:NAD(P)-dependent dehydrogenase (short-subunit alcohol dehydrogenase family)
VTELTGSVALVTGGGGGLGEAICRVLGAAGASVVVADVRAGPAHAVAAALRDEGARATALELDVCDERVVEAGVRRVVEEQGHLDVLINNAGVDVTRSVEELSVEEWDLVTRVNLRGPFVMAKAAMPLMRQNGGGQMVNVVSTAAKRTWANASAYHASKWGLLGLSHALHVEGRLHGIKVTAVVAGGMRTPFILDRFPDVDPASLQDPRNVAETIRFVLTRPPETVIPEIMVLPMRETSWP